MVEKYSYDAFGTPTTTYSNGVFNNRFKFTGREHQPTFGIYEYRNRAYHPGLGRFLSEDPLGFAAGDANLFRYCGNDPVNWSDPSGLVKYVPKKKQAAGNLVGYTVNFGSNGYTPTGSHIPQTVIGTWNGTSWDLTTRDTINGTQSIGSFVLASFGSSSDGGNGNEGGAVFVSTSTPLGSIIEAVTKALDENAPWVIENKKEVAGTINSNGEIIVGPEKDRTALTSNPGPISANTAAVWHLHPMGVPGINPYRFSWKDNKFISDHSNLPFFVGVPDAPPGQFTVFGWTPEMPFYHYVRYGPNSPRD